MTLPFYKSIVAGLLVTAIFCLSVSCKKSTPQEPEPVPPPPPAPVIPKTFPVTVKLVAVNAARILWVPPQRSPGDTLTYDIYFENSAVALNYKQEEYYFSSLLGQKTYTGHVVARFPKGDTISTAFAFTTLKGSIFLADRDYSQNVFIRCFDLSGKEQWNFHPPYETLVYSFLSTDTLYSFSKNRLYCLNANDGSVYWSKSVLPIPEQAPVYTADKIIYMSDLKVTALNQRDGSVAWQSARYSINSRFTKIAYKDLFFMRVDYEDLYAFDVKSGAIVWQMRPPETGTESHPAVANDMIIATNDDEVYAIHAYTGRLMWTLPIAKASAPVTHDGLAYISSEGLMTAIEIATGRIAWQKSGLGYSNSNPTLDEMRVYCLSFSEPRSSGNVLINAFDLKTGAIKWSSSRPNFTLHHDPVVADGVLYFAGFNPHTLYQVNAESGAYSGRIDFESLPYAPFILRVREKNYYHAQSGLVQ